MKTYEVTLIRTTEEYAVVQVDAETEDEAEALALAERDLDWEAFDGQAPEVSSCEVVSAEDEEEDREARLREEAEDRRFEEARAEGAGRRPAQDCSVCRRPNCTTLHACE